MITVELADPGAFHAKTPLGDWFVSAANAGRLKEELNKSSFLSLDGEKQVLRLGALADDGTLLYVPADGSPLWFYRTINATRDLYFRQGSGGTWFFADHFRNMMAGLPFPDRSLEENALIDHLLFQHPIGESTRVKDIHRLTPGELRFILPFEGVERSLQVEKISAPSFSRGMEEAVSDLERAFEELMGYSDSAECTLFSGGVDSSLVHAFRPKGSKALSARIDSPEFAFEAEYSHEAARLLGAEWSSFSISEAGYAPLFREAIESVGHPVNVNFQPVLLHVAYQAPFSLFWLADGSDTLFGHTQSRRIMNPTEKENFLGMLEEPFGSTSSLGALAEISPDIKVIRKLFGDEAVEKRVQKRLSYVLERSGVHEGSAAERQAELASLVEFLGNTMDTVSRKRQAAAVFGKEIREPFFSRRILAIATATHPLERFYREGEVKPLPKALLRKKLPEYSFYGRKGGSDIPRTRFCQSGPFRDFFRESPFPDLLSLRAKELLLDPQWDWSYMTLAAAAFSTWQEKVLKNDKLGPVPGTRVFRLETPGASGTAEGRG